MPDDIVQFSASAAEQIKKYVLEQARDPRFPSDPNSKAIQPATRNVQVIEVLSTTPTGPSGDLYSAQLQLYSGSTSPTGGGQCYIFDIRGNDVIADKYLAVQLFGVTVATGTTYPVFAQAESDGGGGTVDPDTSYQIGQSPIIMMTSNNWQTLVEFDAGVVASGFTARALHGLYQIYNVGTGAYGAGVTQNVPQGGNYADVRTTARDTYCATGWGGSPYVANYVFEPGNGTGIGGFQYSGFGMWSKYLIEIKSDASNQHTQVRIDFVVHAGN